MIFRMVIKLASIISLTLIFMISYQNKDIESEELDAYRFQFSSIDGGTISLSSFRGSVILIVNTASKCGLTDQFRGLKNLSDRYKDSGLIVIGVPSNDFFQEPGDDSQIRRFCSLHYNIDFPMTTKTHVVSENAHPFYVWAKQQLGPESAPRWNFHKLLINSQGQLVKWFSSQTPPEAKELTDTIDKLLFLD